MLKTVRLVEAMSGERLVYLQTRAGSWMENPKKHEPSLESMIEALRRENRELKSELARIKKALGID